MTCPCQDKQPIVPNKSLHQKKSRDETDTPPMSKAKKAAIIIGASIGGIVLMFILLDIVLLILGTTKWKRFKLPWSKKMTESNSPYKSLDSFIENSGAQVLSK
jgi:hypothetical protein